MTDTSDKRIRPSLSIEFAIKLSEALQWANPVLEVQGRIEEYITLQQFKQRLDLMITKHYLVEGIIKKQDVGLTQDTIDWLIAKAKDPGASES